MIWRLAQDFDLPEFWPCGHLKGPKTENEALNKIEGTPILKLAMGKILKFKKFLPKKKET